VEGLGTLVEPRGRSPEVLEGIDRSLDWLYRTVVTSLVEAGGSAAPAAPALAVGPLVLRGGDVVIDLASSQVAAVAAEEMRLVAPETARPGARAPTIETGNSDAFHYGDELRGVAH
jgi:hypothetical protein